MHVDGRHERHTHQPSYGGHPGSVGFGRHTANERPVCCWRNHHTGMPPHGWGRTADHDWPLIANAIPTLRGDQVVTPRFAMLGPSQSGRTWPTMFPVQAFAAESVFREPDDQFGMFRPLRWSFDRFSGVQVVARSLRATNGRRTVLWPLRTRGLPTIGEVTDMWLVAAVAGRSEALVVYVPEMERCSDAPIGDLRFSSVMAHWPEDTCGLIEKFVDVAELRGIWRALRAGDVPASLLDPVDATPSV